MVVVSSSDNIRLAIVEARQNRADNHLLIKSLCQRIFNDVNSGVGFFFCLDAKSIVIGFKSESFGAHIGHTDFNSDVCIWSNVESQSLIAGLIFGALKLSELVESGVGGFLDIALRVHYADCKAGNLVSHTRGSGYERNAVSFIRRIKVDIVFIFAESSGTGSSNNIAAGK